MLKVSNLVNPKNAAYFNKPRFDQIFKEITTEVDKSAKFTRGWIVNQKMECYGAECGSVFLEFQTKEDSEIVLENLDDTNYGDEKVKIVCVPEEAYVNYYLKRFDVK